MRNKTFVFFLKSTSLCNLNAIAKPGILPSKNFKGQERGVTSEEWKNHLPIVVITVPAKKKDELMSQRLV